MRAVAYVRAAEIYNDSRSTKEINVLAEMGYEVFVFGWDRNGGAMEKCKAVFSQENVKFSFFDKPIPNGIGAKNILKLLGFFRWVKKSLKRIRKDIVTVHASDLDAGIPASAFCKRYGKALVYDIFDYYVDAHYLPSPLKKLVERKDISVINGADVTIICTEERAEQLEKASPRDLVVVHNSPDIKECPEGTERYDYAYFGGLMARRLIEEIASGYNKNSDLKFVFGGYGNLAPCIEELGESYENFDYKGSVPYSEVLSYESDSRVISAIYEPTIRNHRLCAPNKFYEAMALAKPVIVCRGTGIDRIVEENGIGLVINYSSDEFYAAVRKLRDDPELSREMGRRGRELYEREYSWEIMKERLKNAYKKAEEGRKSK